MLSLAAAAAAKGKCVETIYRLVRSQRLRATKDEDGNWQIRRGDLEEYYSKRQVAV